MGEVDPDCAGVWTTEEKFMVMVTYTITQI